MLRGANSIKPCISKILIESVNEPPIETKGYTNPYVDKTEVPTNSNKIKLTFELALKMRYNVNNNFLKQYRIFGKQFTSESKFNKFLVLNPKAQTKHILKAQDDIEVPIPKIDNLSNYIFAEGAIKYVNIPVSITLQHLHQGDNPDFLAYSFGIFINKSPINKLISHEVVFKDGSTYNKSGYFTISNTFVDKNQEQPLYAVMPQAKKPNTGTTDPIAQINSVFGAPGDTWAGPIHFRKITTGANEGAYRAMAGAKHGHGPHPYLDFNMVPNTKILDLRNIIKVQKLFVSNKNAYGDMLSVKKTSIDSAIKGNPKPIFSNVKYAIRPVKINNEFKHVVNMIFAVDKLELLKQNTAFPNFLDILINYDSYFVFTLANNINIEYFEIIRINKITAQSQSLLVGNNDESFDDLSARNSLKYNISKGYRLRKKTNIKFNNQRNISFYEFRDAGIDNSKYDSSTYTYKIILKFRDPLIDYLNNQLLQLRQVVKDINEYSTKTQLKYYDDSIGKVVNLFDGHQNRFNGKFVETTLNDTNTKIPFSFGFTNETPTSVATAFPPSAGIGSNNLLGLLLLLNAQNNNKLRPKDDFGDTNVPGAAKYIRQSLRLSQTTPVLIHKMASFLRVLENRLIHSIELYSKKRVTRKQTGFQYTDYLKSTNVNNSVDSLIEFHYTFKDLIDLSQAKNRFNWISQLPDGSAQNNLKTISRGDYKAAVKSTSNKVLTKAGKLKIGIDSNYSYSFLPMSPMTINLFNNHELGEQSKYIQAFKERMLNNTTNNPESVALPEVLSLFGIKFKDKRNLDFVFDSLTQKQSEIDFKDNWGSAYLHEEKGNTNGVLKWAGQSANNYPLLISKSLFNTVISNVPEGQKNKQFLSNIGFSENTFLNKDVPFIINLLSSGFVNDSANVNQDFMNVIFDKNGQMRMYNYSIYILFMSLFAKVHYLSGFENRSINRDLVPSSYYNTTLIKSMSWLPVNHSVLNSLSGNEELLCKITLLEEGEFLDPKIVDLFRKYFNYNQCFYISADDSVSPLSNISFDVLMTDGKSAEKKHLPQGVNEISMTSAYINEQVVTQLAASRPALKTTQAVEAQPVPVATEAVSQRLRGASNVLVTTVDDSNDIIATKATYTPEDGTVVVNRGKTTRSRRRRSRT
jgi:hypothetical protein